LTGNPLPTNIIKDKVRVLQKIRERVCKAARALDRRKLFFKLNRES